MQVQTALTLGLRAGAGGVSMSGVERCRRDEYRLLHPTETV